MAAGKAPSKYWRITTIRKIITNDVYLGRQWYNRKRSEKNPDASGGRGDAKYRVSKNPKEDWIAVPVPDVCIPKEWIESARKIVRQNIKPTNKGRRPWELKGYLFCECGVRMTTNVATRKGKVLAHHYYVCNRHKVDGKGACPYARYHRAEELEHRVERMILDLTRRPEIMLEHRQREIESSEQAASSATRDAAMYQEQLRRVDQKRSGFQDMAAEGLITFAEVRSKLDALQRESKRAQEALEALKGPERVAKELAEIPARVEDYIAELPQLIHEDPERKSEYLKDIYRKLSLSVIAHKDGALTISGAFGNRELEPHDPGPFIGIKATYDLDSEAYTWTEIPPPDSEFWDTWKEGDPVIWVRRKSPSSRWGTRTA